MYIKALSNRLKYDLDLENTYTIYIPKVQQLR